MNDPAIFAYIARPAPLSSKCVGTMADLRAGRLPPLPPPGPLFPTAAEAVEHWKKTQPCLCGASTVDAWTAGVHHGAHRCARVITRFP